MPLVETNPEPELEVVPKPVMTCVELEPTPLADIKPDVLLVFKLMAKQGEQTKLVNLPLIKGNKPSLTQRLSLHAMSTLLGATATT